MNVDERRSINKVTPLIADVESNTAGINGRIMVIVWLDDVRMGSVVGNNYVRNNTGHDNIQRHNNQEDNNQGDIRVRNSKVVNIRVDKEDIIKGDSYKGVEDTSVDSDNLVIIDSYKREDYKVVKVMRPDNATKEDGYGITVVYI